MKTRASRKGIAIAARDPVAAAIPLRWPAGLNYRAHTVMGGSPRPVRQTGTRSPRR